MITCDTQCPKCKSENIHSAALQVGGRGGMVFSHCWECGYDWSCEWIPAPPPVKELPEKRD